MKDKCNLCEWQDPQLPCHCFKLGKILSNDERYIKPGEECEFWEFRKRLI